MSVADKNTRAFVTPEGVDLRLQIGDGGQRAAAFFIDTVIIMAALVALTLLAVATGITSGGQTGMEVAAIIWLLVAFLLRNFYFTAFELSAAAATPGGCAPRRCWSATPCASWKCSCRCQ